MAKKNICIIGGGGFIGSALRRCLTNEEADVFIIGRSGNIELAGNEKYFSIQEYTFNSLQGFFRHLNDVTIIDLAYTSVPGTSYEDPVKDFSDNLFNVIQHLQFATSINAQKFLYVSSGGTVYGDVGIDLITEEAANFPLSPYGVTKLSCERYVYMYHRIHGLPAIIVRPSNIYGPGQKPFRGQGLVATALGLAYKGEHLPVFGDGTHTRDYLFIDDFCEALLDVIHYGSQGEIYNIGSGEGLSINELVAQINKVLHNDKKELRQVFSASRPFDVHHNVLKIDKLKTLNGWQPRIDLSTGIQSTWQWMKGYMQHNL